MIWTQQLITQWSERTFGPHLSIAAIVARANLEMAELVTEVAANPAGSAKALEEVADIVIVLSRVATICGGDLLAAIDKKMDVNIKRKWVLNGDGTGRHE